MHAPASVANLAKGRRAGETTHGVGMSTDNWRGLAEVLVDELDGGSAFADGRGDPLD